MDTDGFHFRKKKIDLALQSFAGQSQASAERYKENIPQRSGPPKTNRQGRMDGWFRLIRFLSGFGLCSGAFAVSVRRNPQKLPKKPPKVSQKVTKTSTSPTLQIGVPHLYRCLFTPCRPEIAFLHHIGNDLKIRVLQHVSFPKQSMGLVHLPTIYHQNQPFM